MRNDYASQLSDQVIDRVVGTYAVHAGTAYLSDNRVSGLRVAGNGALLATVQGTERRPYTVVVTPTSGPPHWVGRCTCPIGIRCKHVAAVLLAARDSLGLAVRKAPSWEAPLAALVQARAATTGTAPPLALQFDVIEPRPTASQHAWHREEVQQPVRVRLRPVMPGRNGSWVRSGVTWRELQGSYGLRGHDQAHRDVLRGLCAAYVANGHSYYGYGGDLTIHLHEVGSALWHLLAEAHRVGLELVPAKKSAGGVSVLGPVDISLDVRHDSSTSSAVLTPVVTVDGHPVEASGVELLGPRLHGLFVTDRTVIADIVGSSTTGSGTTGSGPGASQPLPSLLLAPITQPPDDHVAGLLRVTEPLTIPADELPRFLQVYYPVLRQALTVTSADGSVSLPEIVPPHLDTTVTFLPDHQVGLEWTFAYGPERVPVAGGPSAEAVTGRPAGTIARDRLAEQGLLDSLDAGLRALVPRATLTGMDAVSFARDLLPDLRSRADVALHIVGVEPTYRLADMAPLIRLAATDVSDDPDWFDLGVSVSIDEEEIPFDELFRALASDETHLLLPSGTYFSLQRPELEQLRLLIAEARGLQDRAATSLRLSVYQTGLWEELRQLGVIETQSRRWAAAVQGLIDLEELPPRPLPAELNAVLRPYQLDGYQWLTFLREHDLGGILADDMGLGKTIQTLAMICHARETSEPAGPFLVVAPTSVVANWAHEAARFAPSLKVRAITETVGRRGTPLAEDIAGADVVVTSYALFRIDFDAYQELPWDGLILDEAQFVKNHEAKTYQCARRLRAPFKLAITGTPLENSLMDLWSLLSIVAPGLFPSPQRFTAHYRKPIERGGDAALLSTLRRRIRPLLLRRTKGDVVAELPPKQEQVLEVQLNPRHQKIYQTHLQRERQKVLGMLTNLDRNRFAIFRSLTILRQLSLDPSLVDPAYADVRSSKTDAFLEQLHQVVREGHRALVFSQFTGYLRTIRAQLDAEGTRYCYLDGRTRNRPAVIDAFKQGDAPVFLISLKAGGVGLNLTEADYCFILDPWWNPAVEAQAVDRTHRIGQNRTVMVYRLVAAGTIEEKVMELKARKQVLFDRVMDDDALMSAPLSVDDIRGLFI